MFPAELTLIPSFINTHSLVKLHYLYYIGMTKPVSHRLWYLDFIRGLAVVGMITYHLLVDLYLLGSSRLDPFSFPTIVFARLIAFTFLFLVGVSFYLSKQSPTNPNQHFVKTLKRSLVVFTAAGLVSITTFFISPEYMVRFGILNLISVSLLLLLPLSLIKSPLLLLSIAALFVITPQTTPIRPTFDYYPLFPWFGVILLGYILTGRISSSHSTTTPSPLTRPLILLGRHSLAAYLLHQPLLLLVIALFRES